MQRVGKKRYLLLLCFMMFAFAVPLVVSAASEDEPEIIPVPYRYEASLGEVTPDDNGKNKVILNVELIEPADAALYTGAFGFQLPEGYEASVDPGNVVVGSGYVLQEIGLNGTNLEGTLNSGMVYYAVGWRRLEPVADETIGEQRIHLLEIPLWDTDTKKVADLTIDDIQLLHFEDMVKEQHPYDTVSDTLTSEENEEIAATFWRTATAEDLQIRPDRVGYYQGYFRHNVEVNTADLPVTIEDLPELVAKRLPADFEGKLVVERKDGAIRINGIPYTEFICPVELDIETGILHIELQVQTDIDCNLTAELESGGVITSYDPKKPVTIKWYLKNAETGEYPADYTGTKELPVWQGPAGGNTEEGGGTSGGGTEGGEVVAAEGDDSDAGAGTETPSPTPGSDIDWDELDTAGQKTFYSDGPGKGKGTWRYDQKASFTVNEAGIYRVEISKPGHIRAIYEDLPLAKGECPVPKTFLIPGNITDDDNTELDNRDKTKFHDRTILLGFIHHNRMKPPVVEGNDDAEAKLAKYEREKYCADIDGDGKINMQDLNILMHQGYYNQVEEVVRQNN